MMDRTDHVLYAWCFELYPAVVSHHPPAVFPFSFVRCVQSNIVLLTQAFRKKFVIPDFMAFSSHIDELYETARTLSGGQVRDVPRPFPLYLLSCLHMQCGISFCVSVSGG